MLRRGYHVEVTEVEGVVRLHPQVESAAVIILADPEGGERLKACVVPKKDSNISSEDVVEFCRAHLADFKVPSFARLYHDLPRTQTGEFDRDLLID